MTFGSRIALRVPDVTLDVFLKDTDGTLAASPTYDDIPAMHQQSLAKEMSGMFGEVTTTVTDVFIFEKLVSTGALPVIVEEHVIVWSGTNYEVISAVNPGRDERLFVATERVR